MLILRILAPYTELITRVDLFGSRARGTARPNSDIDLVLHGPVDQATLDRLWTLFWESSLPFKVDIKAYALTDYAPLKRHMDTVCQPLFSQADLKQQAAKGLGD